MRFSLYPGLVYQASDFHPKLADAVQYILEGKSYGYGVEFYETAIGSAVGHPGSIPGYASLTLYVPEQNIAIAAITNDNEHGEAQLAALLDNGCGDCEC